MSRAKALLIESGAVTLEEAQQVNDEYPDDRDSDIELLTRVVARLLQRLFRLESKAGLPPTPLGKPLD